MTIDWSKIDVELDMSCTATSVKEDFGRYLSKMPNEVIVVLNDWCKSHRHFHEFGPLVPECPDLCRLMQESINEEFQVRVKDAYDAMEEADRENSLAARKSNDK